MPPWSGSKDEAVEPGRPGPHRKTTPLASPDLAYPPASAHRLPMAGVRALQRSKRQPRLRWAAVGRLRGCEPAAR